MKRQRAITGIRVFVQIERLASARQVIKIAPFLGGADLIFDDVSPALPWLRRLRAVIFGRVFSPGVGRLVIAAHGCCPFLSAAILIVTSVR